MLESCECGTRAWTIATLFKDTSILYSAGGQHHGRLGGGGGRGEGRGLDYREAMVGYCLSLENAGTGFAWTYRTEWMGGGGGGGGGCEGALDYREAEVGCLSLESAGTECAWTM